MRRTSGILLYSWLILLGHSTGARVVELGDKFLEYVQQENFNPWLVMFYAPWCHHCKQLEPIYNQAGNDILRENFGVYVGKVDCTKYTSLASRFRVTGFPTVLYIDRGRIVEFTGDRTREELVEFARRLSGPNIRSISDCIELNSLRKNTPIMIVYFGPEPIWSNFSSLSLNLHSSTWFYHAKFNCDNFEHPSIYILKSSNLGQDINLKYDNETGNSLSEWIASNKFPHFVRIAHSNLNSLMISGKLLAIGIVEEVRQTGKLVSSEQERFKDSLEKIAHSFIDQEIFIFGWTSHFDLINSIVMHTIDPLPNFIVMNSSTLEYYTIDGEPNPSNITKLLNQLRSSPESLKAYGGNRIHHRLWRMCFDGYSSVTTMYKGNPVLTLLVFGLPLSFLAVILYSSCCSDMLDGPDDETESEEEAHENHEKAE